MSLNQQIFTAINVIKSQDFTAIKETETTIFQCISNAPQETIRIFLQIINNNPGDVSSILCLTLVNQQVVRGHLFSNDPSSIDFAIQLKNQIMQFATDDRFPDQMNSVILNILYELYLYNFKSNLPQCLPFNEYITFLLQLLQHHRFRSNALEYLYSKPTIKLNSELFSQIISLCDISSPDTNFRSKSFCVYLKTISYKFGDVNSFIQQLISSFPGIFSQMPDSAFIPCLDFLIESYKLGNLEEQELFSRFFPPFFSLMVQKLLEPDSYDLDKVSYIHFITEMFSSKSFFQFISQNEVAPVFFQCIYASASDPSESPELYEEVYRCLKTVYTTHIKSKNILFGADLGQFTTLFQQSLSCPNPYISSLFFRFSDDFDSFPMAVQFAFNEDEIIRHNGLAQLNQILNLRIEQFENSQLIELFKNLLASYCEFHEEMALKAITTLSSKTKLSLRCQFLPFIIELCNQVVSFDVIKCASYYVDISKTEEFVQFSTFLLELIGRYVNSEDNYTDLEFIMDFLPKIAKTVSYQSIKSFLDAMMETILPEPKVFAHKNMETIIELIQNDASIDLLPMISQIYQQIATTIENCDYDENGAEPEILKSVESICLCLDRIPFYSRFIPDFQTAHLDKLFELINHLCSKNDPNIRGHSIKCFGELYSVITTSSAQNWSAFFLLFDNEEDIFILLNLLSLFKSIINPQQDVAQMLELYRKLLNKALSVVVSAFKSDLTLDESIKDNCKLIFTQLFNIADLLLRLFPQETLNAIFELIFAEDKAQTITVEYDLLDYNSIYFNNFYLSISETILKTEIEALIQPIINDIVSKMITKIYQTSKVDNSIKLKALAILKNKLIQYEFSPDLISHFIGNVLIPMFNIEENGFDFSLLIFLQTAINAIIVIVAKYGDKLLNMASFVAFIAQNANQGQIIDSVTFEALYSLLQLSFSSPGMTEIGLVLLQDAVGFVEKGVVETSALQRFYASMSENSQIPEVLLPLIRIISQQLGL